MLCTHSDWDKLDTLIHPTFTSLGCGWKPENPEETHVRHGETKQTPHTHTHTQWLWSESIFFLINVEITLSETMIFEELLYNFVFYELVFNFGGIYIGVELRGHMVTV